MIAAFDLLLVLSILFIFFILGKRGVETAIEESRCKYAVAGWLEDLARNATLVKWANGQRFVAETTDRLARDYLLAAGQPHGHGGLTAAGPGQDQQRTLGVLHRLLLHLVKCHWCSSVYKKITNKKGAKSGRLGPPDLSPKNQLFQLL